MSRRLGFIGVAVVLGAILSLALAEGAARIYVYFIAERGKLFQPDPVLGWAPIPNLATRRRNPQGDLWNVETTTRGFRSAEDDFRPDAERWILVLGDSFVFGQGVELADRFDSRVAEVHPEWSFVNQGVMGYGTDQQLIAARETIRRLREGDVIVLVTFLNDFVDLLHKTHSGRGKPWFEIVEGELLEHPPELGIAEQLRDRSYLLARLFQEISPHPTEFPEAKLRVSGHIYRRLVIQETTDAVSRGVRVLIAHHGRHALAVTRNRPLKTTAGAALSRTCETPGIDCVSLDLTLASPRRDLFQPDGHWNAAGNAAVAKALATALERTIASEPLR